jgi:glycosyltransferase involved in cell wall biosynthesis
MNLRSALRSDQQQGFDGKALKVIIPLASSSQFLSGVQRHAINLARCLLTRKEIAQVTVVAAPWQMDFVQDALPSSDPRLHLRAAPIGASVFSRNLWFYSKLPELARQLNADIVHLAYPVPMRRRAFHCPTVVTLHDMYPYEIPENFGFPKVLFNREVLRSCLERIDAIASVSQYTQFKLESIYPQLSKRKTVVIQNSVEPLSGPQSGPLPGQSSGPLSGPLPRSREDIPAANWGDHPFLLCVAQHRRNKNIVLALRIFERLLNMHYLAPRTRMLIVGIHGPETAAINEYVATAGLESNIVFLNGISDAQLQWCYRNCWLLLAPSIVEGFGLPVAEAILAGCRVVCSDIPSFRELGEDHCRFVPLGPNETERFARAICEVIGKEAPKPATLPQLSAPFIAEQYLQLYRSFVPAPGAPTVFESALFSPAGERNPLLRT